jgi:DNA-binding transcriptional ArsR family regulator
MLRVHVDKAASAELSVGLDQIVTEGARRMLAAALEAEVDAYVSIFTAEVDEDGRRLVVRNGHAEQFVERSPAPTLLPILRSRQQGEILAWLLDDADREASLTELSRRLRVPASSVHREIQRAERAGLIVSRRVGQTRLVRANKQSRFLAPLRQLLVMSFGAPERLASALSNVSGVQSAHIFGSWAARYWTFQGFAQWVTSICSYSGTQTGTWFTTKSRKWSPSWAIQSR